MTRILMVCRANICRSPMAEVVMADLLARHQLYDWQVDSAGTHARVNAPAHERTREVLRRHGHQRPPSVARQLEWEDLQRFDVLLAMDRHNLSFVLRYQRGSTAQISLLMEAACAAGLTDDVTIHDPYPDGDYDLTYERIAQGCAAWLQARLKR
jgi:protein-tyrosine phosphatase